MQKEDKEEEIVVNSAPVKKSHLGLILTIVGIFVILILLKKQN